MTKLLTCLCALVMIAALLGGCVQRAADDVSDTVSSVASDMKEDADKYGKTDDSTDGMIGDGTEATMPTMADMDQMIENGVIDDNNDDSTDGDNIDDDALDENAVDDSGDGDNADGGDHNAETMNNEDSDFI